jgi:preprotein translocase subunit SecE
MADKIKIALAALLVVAGLAGFYYFAESPAIVRLGSVLAGLAAAAFVFWTTRRQGVLRICAGISGRDRKVVWPTRKETIQTTAVVFAFVVVMALFLWAVDASLLWVVKKLMGQGE